MKPILKLMKFVQPYWRRAALALVILTSLVFLDLAIPRLIERIIDDGIAKNDQSLVIQTALIMVGISVLSTILAIANSVFSVQIGESVASGGELFGRSSRSCKTKATDTDFGS